MVEPIRVEIAMATFLEELKVATLKNHARSHGVKLGRNKTELIQNILDAATTRVLMIEAPKGKPLSVGLQLKYETREKNS
jgi:hypothetical protein